MATGHRPDGGPVIDCHAHLMPPAWRSSGSPPALYDVDGVLEQQDRGGVDTSVFGNNWIRRPQGRSTLEAVKEFNDFAAEVTARHPGRFLGLASCVPTGDVRDLLDADDQDF